jgi:hypothetical protein
MKPELAKALSDHLDRHNQEKRDAVVRASERENQIAQNVADFEATKNAVIKPAFQEIIDLYHEKGISIQVDEHDEVTNRTGGIQPPSIGINMAAAYPPRPSDMEPGFKLSFEKGNRTLSLYTSTETQSGPAGSVTLDAITAEWIHSGFAKYQGIGPGPRVFGEIVSR